MIDRHEGIKISLNEFLEECNFEKKGYSPGRECEVINKLIFRLLRKYDKEDK